jgi:Flp pilus assembly protein TadD
MAFIWPVQKANSSQTQDISTAWNYYNKGQYSKAEALFLKVSSGDAAALSHEAQLGLAYTRLKTGRTQSAMVLLKDLVEKNYKLDETLPALMGVLSANGDFSAMAALLPRFSEKERSRWQDAILEGRLRVLFSPDILAEKGPLSMDDIQKSQEALERCVAPDVFFDIAGRLMDQGKTDAGGQILETLLGCDTDLQLRFGILSRLPGAFSPETALTLINQQIKQHPGLSLDPFAREMKRLKIQLLQSKLNTLPTGSNYRMVVIKQILDLDPGNPAGLTESGWYFYHKHDYERAILFFQKLMAMEPENMDHVLGLGYSLYQLKRLDEAAELMATDQIKETKKILELKVLVYHALAQDALARGDKARADMLMGVLEGLFDKTGSPALAQQLLSLYRDGDTKKGWQLARRLAAQASPSLKSEAAAYYYNHNSPILASQTTDAPDRCFTNADSPRIHVATRYRNKDGDEGTSQLDETAFIAQLVYPYSFGYQWSVSFKSNRLSSGSTPPIYSVGSFYRYLNGQEQLAPVTTDEKISHLAVGWKNEGPILWDLLVGTSPINGPVDVTPIFSVKAEMDKWEFEIHRTNITESILSYTGLEDPFGNEPWGRVVKNGFEAGKSFDLGNRNWLNIKAGADTFRGENVWNNSAWHLNTAVGRSVPWNNHFDITYGLYLTGMGFENNTNFFTYGHGGYYSPDFMVSGGPIFRIKTPVCKDYWLDLQLSVGWMTEQTSDSPRYPLGNETMNALTLPNALDEFQGRYEGETNSRLSYSVNLEAWKLLTRHLAIGGNISMERSSAHSEWQTWIGFELFFNPQNAFWRQRSLAHRSVLYRD